LYDGVESLIEESIKLGLRVSHGLAAERVFVLLNSESKQPGICSIIRKQRKEPEKGQYLRRITAKKGGNWRDYDSTPCSTSDSKNERYTSHSTL